MSAGPEPRCTPAGGGARSACWEVQRAALVARCRVREPALAGRCPGCRGSRPRGPLGVPGHASVSRWGCRAALVARCGVQGAALVGRSQAELCAEAGGAFITARPKLRCLHCLFALGVR